MTLQPKIGGGKHLGKRHAATVPSVDGVVFQAQGRCPIPQIHRAPVELNNRHWLAGVVPLFLCSCPTTVFRAVVLVAVYSVDCQIARAFAHIGQEILKRLPAFAYLDAFGCVRLGLFPVDQSAARNHAGPNVVGPSARHTVFSGVQAARFGLQASTGLNIARAEPGSSCLQFFAAIAQAIPPIGAIDKTGVRLHNQPVEPVPSLQRKCRHVLAHINVNARMVIDVLLTRTPKYAKVML